MDRYPALKFFIALLLGILAASAFSIPLILSAILLLLSLAMFWVFRRARSWLPDFMLYLALSLAGIFSYQIRQIPSAVPWAGGSRVEMALKIASEPLPSGSGWRCRSCCLAFRSGDSWHPVNIGQIVSGTGTAPEYGDILDARGIWRNAAPRRNPGGFDYRGYLDHQEISGLFSIEEYRVIDRGRGNWLAAKAIIPARKYARKLIASHLSGDHASLMAGLLLGERSDLSPAVREAFSNTGTMHVLAVSGLHAVMVAFILFMVFRMMRLPRRAACAATIIGLMLYTLITGATPSIVRSAIMTGAVLLGGMFERHGSGLNLLGLAGMLILGWWPEAAFDLGFQLSFAATAGILVLTRPLEAVLFMASGNDPLRKWLLTPLAVSAAATVFTAPFMAWNFHRIPLISLMANLVVVPLTNGVLALGIALWLLGFLGSWLSWPLAACSYAVAEITLKTVVFFGSLEFGIVNWPSPSLFQLIMYAAATALPFLWKRGGRLRLALLTVVLSAATLAVWQKAVASTPGLKATFLDVGQGDCALVEFPNGRRYLIDAGLSTPGRDSGKDVIIPFLRSQGIARLDAIIISHSDADHCGGLSYLLDHVKVGKLVISGHPSGQPIFNRALEKAAAAKVPVQQINGYDTLKGTWPARGFLYSREDSVHDGNESSLVLYLRYGATDILFSGDMGPELEGILARRGLLGKCRVLKVPHHGARGNNSRELIETIAPELAVVSVGENNRFGHPAREAMDVYASCGSKVLRTDQCGAVLMETDGHNMTYKSMIQ